MDSKAPSGGGVRPPLPPKGDTQGAPPPQPPPRKNKRSGFGFSKKDQVRKRGVEADCLAVSVADCMSYLPVCATRPVHCSSRDRGCWITGIMQNWSDPRVLYLDFVIVVYCMIIIYRLVLFWKYIVSQIGGNSLL